MTENRVDRRDRYYAALSNLFEQVTRDTAFNSNSALHDSAIAAQSALGRVEQRADSLQSAKSNDERRIISEKLRDAESELDAAALNLLSNSIEGNAETANAARELYDALPADVSGKADLAHVKAALDQVLLKQKRTDAPKINPRTS